MTQRYLPLLSNALISSWLPRNEMKRSVGRSWKIKRNARLPRHSNSLLPNLRMPSPLWACGRPKLSSSSHNANKHSALSPLGRSRRRLSTLGSMETWIVKSIRRQTGQKDPRCKARERSTSAGVHGEYVGARRPSATKQMGLFQRSGRGLAKHFAELFTRDRDEFFRSLECPVTPVCSFFQGGHLFGGRPVFTLCVIRGFHLHFAESNNVRPTDDTDILPP